MAKKLFEERVGTIKSAPVYIDQVRMSAVYLEDCGDGNVPVFVPDDATLYAGLVPGVRIRYAMLGSPVVGMFMEIERPKTNIDEETGMNIGSVNIMTDGTVPGTTVTDAKTGDRIDNVKSVSFDTDAETGYVDLVLTLVCVPVVVEGKPTMLKYELAGREGWSITFLDAENRWEVNTPNGGYVFENGEVFPGR